MGATDFKPLLIKVRDAQPDVVFMAAPATEAAFLVRQSKELNLAPKVFVGECAQGFMFLQFMVAAGEASESVFSVDLWGPRLPYEGLKNTSMIMSLGFCLLPTTMALKHMHVSKSSPTPSSAQHH